ncbi:MAG: patatin-like phospholipase family protein [Gammaproteobacteria bacterium]
MAGPRQTLPYGFKINLAKNLEDKPLYQFYVNVPEIRSLVFKGGGARVFVYRKFGEIAHQKGFLQGIKEVGGSSSGAVAAVFAAIPFEDCYQRSKVIEAISKNDALDIMGDSHGWNAYRSLSPALHIVSKPLEWAALFNKIVAKQCNKLPMGIGKVVSTPFGILSSAFKGLSDLVSQRGIAGLYNFVTTGGIYKGTVINNAIRDAIQIYVQIALKTILENIQNPEEREAIINHLSSIDIFEDRKNLVVTKDLTFKHFSELAKLPGSQFKEIFTTGVRLKDKKLIVLNNENTPDMPVYIAVKIAMSLPKFYQLARYQGDIYMDGGAIDNCPIQHVKPQKLTPFQKRYGMTDDMMRLCVRVEYSHGIRFLWDQKKLGWLGHIIEPISHWVLKFFITHGIDTYATEAVTNETIKTRFHHRTLQMEDFGIKRTQFGLPDDLIDGLCELSAEKINFYFDHYMDEKIKIENYTEKMPLEMQIRLLVFLKNPFVKTSDIFTCTEECKSEAPIDLEKLRLNEIERLTQLPEIRDLQISPEEFICQLDEEETNSTLQIFRKTSDTKDKVTWCHSKEKSVASEAKVEVSEQRELSTSLQLDRQCNSKLEWYAKL